MTKTYSKARKLIPFRMEDEKGKTQDYVLQEANGDVRDEYMDELVKRQKSGQEMKGLSAYLIHLHAHRAELADEVDGEGKFVRTKVESFDQARIPLGEIMEWPSSAQQDLSEQASLMSGFRKPDKDEDDPKN